MFERNTLLILGAGASKPYNFPLGGELITDIIWYIENSEVLFPITEDDKMKLFNDKLVSLENYSCFNHDILAFIRNNITNFKGQRFLAEVFPLAEYLDFVRFSENVDNKIFKIDNIAVINIKLNMIDELNKLAKHLRSFNPTSIDAFIRDHPEHRLAGQTMIIYTLLQYHKSKLFSLNDKEIDKIKNPHPESRQDNWYRHLFNDLKSGCNPPQKLLDNKLRVLTFNYDVSLEFYLKYYLSKTSYFSEYAEKFLNDLNIHHIYGQICEMTQLEEFFDIELPQESFEEDKCVISFHHLLYGYLESRVSEPRIKLMGRQLTDEKAAQWIKEAEKIIFVGFSFDRENLSVLGFPRNINFQSYQSFLCLNENTPKKLLYLDFEGKMRGLAEEFSHLKQIIDSNGNQILIRRSTEKSIENAYLNDFKDRLFP